VELTVGIAVLGCGTVGSSVAERLLRERSVLERRSGAGYRVRGIAILDRHKARHDSIDRRLLTTDASSLVDDPHVDLVVEVIGGLTRAAELVERALYRGRHVVTANKELLATHGPRLQALAAASGAALRSEGAVAAAVPILRTLHEALAGDTIGSVAGVVNGTCTSILSAMEDGLGFDEALARAQSLGYAESDPSHDLDGADSAHKLALLAQASFGLAVISPRIRYSGIRHVTQRDVGRARMSGLRIRPVVAAVRTERGILAESAALAVPEDHEFARTAGPQSVVQVAARDAGRLVLRGAGAGGAATASAVLGDVVTLLRAIAQRRDQGLRGQGVALEPAIEVDPLFARLPRSAELPDYPVWDDSLAGTALAQAVNA
jgi:homoserine dehydrogenase